MDSALTWVKHYPEVAPAFVLARQGFDVWMSNQRGTDPSQKHVKFDTDSPEFWDYSW